MRYYGRKKNGRSSNLCRLEFNRQEIPHPSEKKLPFQIFFVLLQLFPVSVSVVGTWCESVRTMQVGHMVATEREQLYNG